MIDTILLAIYCSATVGVLSCLVSESAIMAPIRDRIGWSLLFCPICLGFWFSLPALHHGLLFYFAVVASSNVWMLIILKVYETLEAGLDNANSNSDN